MAHAARPARFDPRNTIAEGWLPLAVVEATVEPRSPPIVIYERRKTDDPAQAHNITHLWIRAQ
jgi:hypothetical protein